MTPAERRFEEVVRACGPRVLAYLTRRTTPVEDAADVHQETLTVAWRRLHTAPLDESLVLPWLLAIARRTLANHRRARTRRLAATDRLRAELLARPEERGDPAADAVRAALDSLDADDRELLTLTYWEGLTGEQVAVALGIRPATARKRLERARHRARGLLDHGSVGVPPRGAEVLDGAC